MNRTVCRENRTTKPILPTSALVGLWGCWLVLLSLPVVVVGGLVGLVVVAALAVGALDRALATPVLVEVLERGWTREVQVERWARVTREGPCSSVPDGAENVRRGGVPAAGRLPHHRGPSSRHHHHSHSPSAPRCTWEVVDWDPVEPRVATGTGEPRRWPQAPPPDACRTKTLGCERESGRTETLTLTVDPRGRDRAVCPVSERLWTSTPVGEVLWLPYGGLWGRPYCDELAARR